uniref:Uncharacterized protein n=1 Tax=viral metagenome TaxID=1070528 RepID=A0A6C0BQI8_9ZZZZ
MTEFDVLEETINVYTKIGSNILTSATVTSNHIQFIDVGDIGGDVDLRDIDQTIQVNLNVQEFFQAFNTEAYQAEIAQEIIEIGKDATQNLPWYQWADAENVLRSYLSAGLSLNSTVEQVCNVTSTTQQAISIHIVGGDVKLSNVSQRAIVDIYMNCVGLSGNEFQAMQDLQTYVAQSSRATATENVWDWWGFVIAGILIIGVAMLIFILPPLFKLLKFIIAALVPLLWAGGALLVWWASTGTVKRLLIYSYATLDYPPTSTEEKQTYNYTASTCDTQETCGGFTYREEPDAPSQSEYFDYVPDPAPLVTDIPEWLERPEVYVDMDDPVTGPEDGDIWVQPDTVQVYIYRQGEWTLSSEQFQDLSPLEGRVLTVSLNPGEVDGGWTLNVANPDSLELWDDDELYGTIVGPGYRILDVMPPTVGLKKDVSSFNWNLAGPGIALLCGGLIILLYVIGKAIQGAQTRS